MKAFHIVLGLLSLTASTAFGKVVWNRAAGACDNVLMQPQNPSCFVDLAVGIDMSTAMGSIANIATLTSDILANFLPKFNFNQTFVAGLAFGASTIQASDYYSDYPQICQYIHSSLEQATQLGLTYANLSAVFQTYQISLLNSGRNYKKVLVLFSATTDPNEIAEAKVYSDQLRAAGVTIYVGAINDPTILAPIADAVWPFINDTFNYSNLTGSVCVFDGYTMHPGDGPTGLPFSTPSSSPADPRSDAIGSACSTNTKNAWLDIVFVIDISAAMNPQSFNDLTGETATYMRNFNIAQRGNHTTRAAIISYATDAVIRLSLNDVTDFTAFGKQLKALATYSDPNDQTVDIQKGLQTAFKLLQDQGSTRQKVIIVTASAYSDAGFDGANHTANEIKEDGITIFTVSFEEPDSVLSNKLGSLATPGYAYISNQDGLYESLPLGLTQVNCFCPSNVLQFRAWDSSGKNFTKYADCLWGFNGDSAPSIIGLFGSCDPGQLAAITSQTKLDFIADKIVPYVFEGGKQFIVGAHNDGGIWEWYGYDGVDYPVGSFRFNNSFNPSPTDQYTYLNNYYGLKWRLDSSGDTPRPYLCESRACDADFICDQHANKKLSKKTKT